MASRATSKEAEKAVGNLEEVLKLVRGLLDGTVEVDAESTETATEGLDWIAPGVVRDVADLRFRVTELEMEIRQEAPRAELLKAGQSLSGARLELQEPQPDPAKVIKRLERATKVLIKAAKAAKADDRLSDRTVRWTLGAAGLWQLAIAVLGE